MHIFFHAQGYYSTMNAILSESHKQTQKPVLLFLYKDARKPAFKKLLTIFNSSIIETLCWANCSSSLLHEEERKKETSGRGY